ncbi:hypothetical protein OFB51_25990, partial [Escherichia coli]|nr:hypothetical protein [Escherichia coli]
FSGTTLRFLGSDVELTRLQVATIDEVAQPAALKLELGICHLVGSRAFFGAGLALIVNLDLFCLLADLVHSRALLCLDFGEGLVD